MKSRLKKLTIFTLVGMFLFSALFCCCFTKTAQAEKETPSCHQTSDQDQSSHDTTDCQCGASLVVLKKQAVKDVQITASLLFDNMNFVYQQPYPICEISMAYHPPSDGRNAVPLYIKHTILRI